jgi:hypothetical protein
MRFLEKIETKFTSAIHFFIENLAVFESLEFAIKAILQFGSDHELRLHLMVLDANLFLIDL